MSFSISCGDVMPGCGAQFRADTEDDLLGQVAAHAQADHGLTPADLTPGLIDQVKSKVVSV